MIAVKLVTVDGDEARSLREVGNLITVRHPCVIGFLG
jgi:hypothetical protein